MWFDNMVKFHLDIPMTEDAAKEIVSRSRNEGGVRSVREACLKLAAELATMETMPEELTVEFVREHLPDQNPPHRLRAQVGCAGIVGVDGNVANGVCLGKKTAEDHFFRFDVPNVGETKLMAVAGECKDESVIRKMDTFNEAYRLVEKGTILNWFDVTEKEGRLSLNSKMGEVLKTFRGKMIFLGLMKKVMGGKKGDKKSGKKKGGMKAMGFEITSDMMSMMNGFSVLRLFTLMGGMMNMNFTKEELLNLNKKLNRIRKPRAKK